MPDDWDPFHHFAGAYLRVVGTACAAAVAAAVVGVVEVAAVDVEGLDYSPLNRKSQTIMHDEKLELHDEKVPKT